MKAISLRPTLIAAAATLTLGGCISTLTPDRIREETSAALGVPASDLTITDQRQEMTNTFYTATTRSGERYACTLNGGNLMTFGMTNPAVCRRAAR